MIFEKYYFEIINILEKIKTTQKDKIEEASNMVAKVIENDGIIYIFGCGHSHLIGLDCFYRAGGLVNVSAMLDTDLMLHNGAAKSSRMEKMSGIASEVFRRYTLTEKDMIFIFSDNDMKNRYEQTQLVLSTLKHFEYNESKIYYKLMHGSHCHYSEKEEFGRILTIK